MRPAGLVRTSGDRVITGPAALVGTADVEVTGRPGALRGGIVQVIQDAARFHRMW